MIHPDFDPSRPLNWCLVAALAGLLAVQVWGLVRRTPPGRRAVRAVLNGLLWLLLAAYAGQPVWQSPAPTTRVLLAGDEVPSAVARHIQDSLHLPERFTTRNYTGDFAQVTLLGRTFAPELLNRLSGSDVRWIPYRQPDQLTDIHWKGMLRQGEMQQVSGRIQSTANQWLRLSYANQTLDSVRLGTGEQRFALQAPAFVRGQTRFDLTLGQTTLDTIRFFTRPAEPMAYQFILDNPDFETKTLADWLGRVGQSVLLTTTVSTNVRNDLTINQPKNRPPDVVITDPGNAANPVVKRAVLAGKRVLFINLTKPDADVRTINQALGSRFSVRSVGNVESVTVSSGLTSLPGQFNSSLSQQGAPGYPVAVQRTAGLVGVSLLNETFPLALSGDSTAYARLWYTLLAPFQPPGRNTVRIDAPVFSGLRSTIGLNNASGTTTRLRVGTDTVRLYPSAINPLSAEGVYRFSRVGWLPVADSLRIFVEPAPGSPVGENRLVGAYVLAHNTASGQQPAQHPPTESRVTEWVWFALVIGCLTALWVEPKLA